jgi:uncharacterized membrane protein YfcA
MNSTWLPITGQTVAATVVICAGAMVSVVGGVGGGGFYVAILGWMMQFPITAAVPVSNTIIFACSAVSLLLRWLHYRHRSGNFIDPNICLLLLPLSLAGTTAGVLLNGVLPKGVIALVLVAVLLASVLVTCRQIVKVKRKHAPEVGMCERQPLPAEGYGASPKEEEVVGAAPRGPGYVQRFAACKMALLAALTCLTLALAVARKFACGGSGYWVSTLLPVPVAVILVSVHGHLFRRSVPSDTDFVLRRRDLVAVAVISFTGGALSSMVGIGTGVVVGPLLYVMSRKKDTILLTNMSTLIVLVNAFVSMAQYAVLGRLPWGYALWFAIGAAVSAVPGFYLSAAFERNSRKHYAAIAMCCVISVSGALVLLQTVVEVVTVPESVWSFHPNPCIE